MLVIGQMSGTSLDAIDFVLCEINGSPNSGTLKIKFKSHGEMKFPKAMYQQLRAATMQNLNMQEIAKLHFALGKQYAVGVKHLLQRKAWQGAKLIGMHGQTVFHLAPHCTWQIGEPSFISQETQLPVAFNFRVADLAAGGEAAPLAPIFHYFVFGQHLKAGRSIHNLGGISNLSYLPPAKQGLKGLAHVSAFDTGPSNLLMNLAMERFSKGKQKFDKDGSLAARGIPHVELVNRWLRHPFIKKHPPKSTGKEDFGPMLLEAMQLDFRKKKIRRHEDQMATLLEFTAQSIAQAYTNFVPSECKEIYFSGGGTQNKTLMTRLKVLLSPRCVGTTEDLGWSPQAIEGGAFALLAYLRLHGVQLNLKSITGSKHPISLGHMVLP